MKSISVLSLLLLVLPSHAFEFSSYKAEDLRKFSADQVSLVKKERKEGGAPEKLGFSFDRTFSKKFRVQTEPMKCQEMSRAKRNFIDSGTTMGILPQQIKDISTKECDLKVNNESYNVVAQTAVADYVSDRIKAKKIAGTAYLLYLGVSNEKAVYLLNKFEPKGEETVQ